ncbi:MAG: hypothetical protein RJB26_264 [Pseudomonadota bacterium]|jgi:hypothetical protein
MSNPALQPAAAPWQDSRPDNLPPMHARCLCRNVSSGRVFVAERVHQPGTTWAWRWASTSTVPADFVDQWAIITLRD